MLFLDFVLLSLIFHYLLLCLWPWEVMIYNRQYFYYRVERNSHGSDVWLPICHWSKEKGRQGWKNPNPLTRSTIEKSGNKHILGQAFVVISTSEILIYSSLVVALKFVFLYYKICCQGVYCLAWIWRLYHQKSSSFRTYKISEKHLSFVLILHL